MLLLVLGDCLGLSDEMIISMIYRKCHNSYTHSPEQ